MAVETLSRIADKVYRIFVFNPDTIEVVKEFISGNYEWSWLVLMSVALLLWNIKCWSFFRDEREKNDQTVLRSVAEGTMHWCLSNAALFSAIELHKAVYQHFTEFVDITDNGSSQTGVRQVFIGALRKVHLMNQKTTLVPIIKNPMVPFGVMLATTLCVISLAFFVKKSERSISNSLVSQDVGSRHSDWD